MNPGDRISPAASTVVSPDRGFNWPSSWIWLPLTRTDSNLEGPPEPSIILALMMRKDERSSADK